jgi:hypothetical protein
MENERKKKSKSKFGAQKPSVESGTDWGSTDELAVLLNSTDFTAILGSIISIRKLLFVGNDCVWNMSKWD